MWVENFNFESFKNFVKLKKNIHDFESFVERLNFLDFLRAIIDWHHLWLVFNIYLLLYGKINDCNQSDHYDYDYHICAF